MKGKLTVLGLLALGIGLCAQEKEEPEEILPPGIIKEFFETKGQNSRGLNLYLKYPSGGKDAVKGVMAICKYGDREIALDLTGGRHFGHLMELANKHSLAVVAFGQPGGKGWNRTVSSDLLSGRQASQQDKKLDALAREWSRIINRFATQHGLPTDGWLMYGICGGAQYAHRVALREPQHFKAVHVHYGGSYDVPTPKGKSIQWMVTSHADEPAYIAAQRFYQAARDLDYDMILKGFTRRSAPEEYDPQLRSKGKSSLQKLSLAFFEHALLGAKSGNTGERYIADYVNGVVVPAKQGSWIPKNQAIHLPSLEIATAWGKVEPSSE